MSSFSTPHATEDREPDGPEDAPIKLTPLLIILGIAAVVLGIAMGFIMSSVWLVR